MADPRNTPPVRNLPPAVTSQVKRPPEAAKARSSLNFSSMPFWFGVLFSIVWVGTVVFVVAGAGPSRTFGGLALANWAIGISAIASPVALIWMVTAYLQRAADVQSIAEPLRRQLMMITGESGAAEARIRRFNQAVREQLELLRSAQNASQDDFAVIMDRVRQHKNELERFEQGSIHQVKEIQTIVRDNMRHIEQLMEDKFTMMRVLDERLVQSSDGVGHQVEAVRHQIAEMLDAVEANADRLASALNRASSDSKKLSETSRMQEASLLNAAESAAETLTGVSGKIDLSIARFLERAGTARGEAEHLAGALEAQTRSLDEFSNTLPSRVSEAESVLRGVADRLYASEQLAREQAVNLSEKLTQQVDGLQQFLDRLGDRLTGFGSNLQNRRDDLEGLIDRVSTTADTFVQRWESSITDLSDRTGNYLHRFSTVNEETRRGADEVVTQMAAASERYENAAHRMHSLSAESASQLKAISAEVAAQLSQFESLRAASQQAGQEVESRAAAALQNLQHVLERLLTARETTQAVGENLVKGLASSVDQNEQLIGRLNEAAQMSVRALGIAAESLGRQEGELASKTRAAEAMLQEAITQTQTRAAAAEKGLRDQTANLMNLLAETQDKLGAADQRLQNFATQAITPIQAAIQKVDASTAQGLQSLNRYGDGLQEQINRLQQVTGSVGGLSEELGRMLGENVTSVEQLNSRFAAARSAQEDTVRQTQEQFSAMADRMQREIAGLGEQTGKAVSSLQQAAQRVADQSNQLLQDAQNSGSQMQIVTSALQNEAGQIRSILQKQTDDLGSDLSRAEKQFLTIGEALKQRTDAAYSLLDRVAAHYNEVTRAASQELESRAQRFEQTATQAQGKADAFATTLNQQLGLIGNGTVQLEAQASQVTAAAGKSMQQLSSLNEKLALTHEAANNNTQQMLSRLEESNSAFMRQSNNLAEASQSAAALIQKAGGAFNEQSTKLLDQSHQAEQYVRNLSSATSALAEQSSQIRTNMEQQSQRLVAQLTEAVIQLEAAGNKLQQTATTATTGTDQVTARLTATADAVSSRLGTSQQELQDIAGRAESTLTSLGASITQQSASLAVVNDQIGEQFRTFTAANENQRSQLVELFGKLGSAHEQASEVAERTITRLTESLQQIQRQLGALSDQSQSTVGNVRTATSGFADQASTLLQNAQQAEQQARTVLSVTAALQDQAKQLREALHGEGERTHEILTTLLGKISTGGADLRELSTSAELVLSNLQNGVTHQAQSLGSSMQQISERQRSLTVSLDAQRDVINGLLNRLALAQDETAATAERTVTRLTDSTQQITRQLEGIDSQAQTTLATVQAAAGKFSDEAGALSLHAQQAEQQMRAVLSVTAGMQEQARTLRESMQGETARVVEQLTTIISQLDNAGSQLKQQSNAAVHAIEQSALRAETLTRNSGEQLQKHSETLVSATARVGEMLDNAATQAEARIANTDEKVRGHLRLVSDVAEQTEHQGRQVSEMIESAVGCITILRDTMAESDRQGRATLVDATDRIEHVKNALHAQMQKLSEVSTAATQQVAAAALDLSAQSDVLRGNLGSSESALKEAAQLLREETVQLPATLDRSTSQITAATETLKTQAWESDKTLLSTADRFISVTGAARETMIDEMKQISRTAGEAEEVLRQFNKSLAEQVQSMQASAGVLSSGQKDLVVSTSDSIAQLASATERLGELRGDATQSAARLAREFEALETKANATTKSFAQTGETVDRALQTLTQTAEHAERQMADATGSFRGQFEAIRAGVQSQIDEINRGLMQITAQLERTGTALRSTTAGTVADVEKISSRFDQTSKEAATQLVDKTGRMRATTEEVAKLLGGLGDQIDTLLDRLAMAGDGIKRHEGNIIGQLQTALSHLGSVAERLETSRMMAGTVSEHAVARLSEVASTVEQHIENLSNKSEATVNVMRNVSKLYGEQTNSLNKGVGEVQGQVVAMNHSIEDMQQRADRLRVSLKLQSEELMGSLQQILNQLSVTGDGLEDAVEQVLREKAQSGLKKM